MIWLDTADNSQARQVRPTHAYEVLRLHRRKVIAAIEDPPVIVKILSRLGLIDPRPVTCTGAASRSIPNDLRTRKPIAANASRPSRLL